MFLNSISNSQSEHLSNIISPLYAFSPFNSARAKLPVVSSSEPLREYFCTCTKESGSKRGRKRRHQHAASGRPANESDFFLLDGDDSPLLRRFQKNSLTAKTREGRFGSPNKSREEEFKNIFSQRETVCVWR